MLHRALHGSWCGWEEYLLQHSFFSVFLSSHGLPFMICVNIAPSFLYRIHRTPRGDEERREGGSWKNEFLYALSFLSIFLSFYWWPLVYMYDPLLLCLEESGFFFSSALVLSLLVTCIERDSIGTTIGLYIETSSPSIETLPPFLSLFAFLY